MDWTIEISESAEKEFKKLPRHVQKDIRAYLTNRIEIAENPRDFGKPLEHDKSGYWRYRVGKYRIVCRIEDERGAIIISRYGKRDEVYKSNL